MSYIERALKRKAEEEKAASENSSPGGAAAETSDPGHPTGQPVIEKAMEHRTVLQSSVGQMDEVPELNVDPHIMSYHAPNSPVAEQIRNISASLKLGLDENNNKSFIISSVNRGEGKTTLSINMAFNIAADIGKRVVLIDADLRRPAVHKYLGIKNSPGLTDYLLEETDFGHILKRTPLNKLYVITSGKPISNPSELLNTRRMRELIKMLRTQFDFCLIDSPPAGPITDTAIIGPYSDGILMVVRAGKTRREVVGNTIRNLEVSKSKVMGIILNEVEYFVPEYIYRYI